MLAYLDALLSALSLRDTVGIRRLLDHPLARILTVEARAEAEGFAAGSRDALAVPLRVMQLRHQTSELLREAPVVADQAEIDPSPPGLGARPAPPTLGRRPSRLVQMELPLSA